MISLVYLFAAGTALAPALSATASPLPIAKRIAQVISDSTQPWVQACEAAGGADKCNPISVTAFGTLLAAAGPCDQQNSADAMIDLAKTLNNDAKMIQLAQIFAQQPRNSPDSLSVPYCQTAPKNSELDGLFQCQFQGVNPKTFVGNVAVGGAGTIPLGMSSPVSPPGSCSANPQGGIADGTQLVSITQDPKAPSGGASPQSSVASSPPVSSSSVSSSAGSAVQNAAPAPTASASSTAGSTNSSGDFKKQNGVDAQALNKSFLALTAKSSCQAGQNACVKGQFAQCVNGKFAMSSCGGNLMCVALPLVNSKGTSITCDSQADAEARISASGATGGLTG